MTAGGENVQQTEESFEEQQIDEIQAFCQRQDEDRACFLSGFQLGLSIAALIIAVTALVTQYF